MSKEKLQTMSMQNFGGVKEVHYGIVQVVNYCRKPKLSYALIQEYSASAGKTINIQFLQKKECIKM